MSEEKKLWYYACQGETFGPFSKKDFIQELKNISSRNEILVWRKGMRSWTPTYECHELLEELGMNQRKYPRIHVRGSVKIHHPEKGSLNGVLFSLSAGGVGVKLEQSYFNEGDRIQLKIHAETLLEHPFEVIAIVRHIDSEGRMGCEFYEIKDELRKSINSYVGAIRSHLSLF
ncbi:MAG: hypothetical protein D6797_07055 [Bdellovibrio sp.]|nr:MAG: hypothetical protein D6797_07055 [Bdellovibrio sp.]